jgi:hypothetical protein
MSNSLTARIETILGFAVRPTLSFAGGTFWVGDEDNIFEKHPIRPTPQEGEEVELIVHRMRGAIAQGWPQLMGAYLPQKAV